MNRFTLDENHIYRLDGQIIPGFSEIAKAEGLSDYSHVSRVVMDAACQFGSAAHKACELSDLKELDLKSLSDPLVPYLHGWENFLFNYKAVVIPEWVERVSGSVRFRFGCKPDRVVETPHELVVVEIKTTTSIAPVVALQTAAHKIVFEEETKQKIKKRLAVQLDPETPRGYRVHEFKKKTDEDCFICIRKAYQWKKENL